MFSFFGGERKKIMENEYCALYDDGAYWTIEIKPVLNLPTVHTGETKTLTHIIVEFGSWPDGEWVIKRVKYPKLDIEYKVVVQQFQMFTQLWEKKMREFERMRALYESVREV